MAIDNITRRQFICSLGAASLCGNMAFADDQFEDLKVDRYYTLQGGQYGDTGGIGSPYPDFGDMLVRDFAWYDKCNALEDNAIEIERNGYYLSQSQYFGKPYCKYEKIPLTRQWIMEFYNRHKTDTFEDWRARYDSYYDALRASGWKVSDDYVKS